MKAFFKNLLSSFLGTLLALSLVSVFSLALVIGLVFAFLPEKEKPFIEEGSVLVFDLSVNIVDAPVPFDFDEILSEFLGGGQVPTLSLRQTLEGIRNAAHDDRIDALILRGAFRPELYGSGFPVLQELRENLQYFREVSGKPVYAYVEAPSMRDYFVASAADEIFLNPSGVIPFLGLAIESIFLTDLLDKLGIGIQIIRAGTYKSATETFTEREMSAENREQTEKLLQDYWNFLLVSVAESRKADPETWAEISRSKPVLTPEEAKRLDFVDHAGHYDELLTHLAQQLNRPDEELNRVPFRTYLEGLQWKQPRRGQAPNQIALLYVEGDIMRGARAGAGQVNMESLVREMKVFREDPQIKAMVLRINSPGGDVLTSELIRRELAKVRETMPVVVSFGTYAASGGYWAAMASDRIFASPVTLTGSIGAFGILPNIEEMREKIGLGYDFVRTSDYATLLSPFREKTDDEMAIWQNFIDDAYQEFTDLVASERDLSQEEIRAVAEGRVWSGFAAKERNLVDEFGGLSAALRSAAEKAGLGEEWEIVEYPHAKTFADVLDEWLSGSPPQVQQTQSFNPLPEADREIRYFLQSHRPYLVHSRLPVLFRID
ncbi:MAG: signal peptide peptidase SppA [Opitutales bacterium]|nr:signal peptide peptidase SppA [Opitutales bacterium]MCH8541370.1 signal peptide peptidase SppA [Opitutales bacterium]